MALDPHFVTAPSLQEYFVDKDSGLPLAGGKVFFYHDSGNRDIPKPVFELQGNSANYTYAPLPNPIILSAVGTIQDDNGNDVIPYYYPFDADGNTDLYYIVVQSSGGVPQFTRSAWPNPSSGQSTPTADTLFNYIPNGQFLNHTDLPNTTTPPYLLSAGTNVLAQGGWSFELDNPTPAGLESLNTAKFVEAAFPAGIPQSPRYVLELDCARVNPLDLVKRLRIKWFDVNKFSFNNPVYTFGFAASAVSPISVTINVHKFFGTNGSPTEDIPIAVTTIQSGSDVSIAYQFQIQFGSNDGTFIDKVNNNDYVAIDIIFPNNLTYSVQMTDFILVAGDVVLTGYPLETNADMMTRSVMGWADTVDPSGMDLYLSPILTRQGMTWDLSQIGQIGMSALPISSPNSTTPIPDNNLMPCDGSTYLTTGFSANGIPYKRLFNYLINTPYNNGLPLYGTGPNYVSAVYLFSGAANTTFRISWNTAGAGSPQAADGAGLGATGFTFSPIYTYNGSTTGSANFGLFASNFGPNQVLFTTISEHGTLLNPSAGNSGFVFTNQSEIGQFTIVNYAGLLAFQKSAWSFTTVSGAALVIAGAGRYFQFYNEGSSQQYFMWFNVDGTNTAPAVAGLPIEVKVSATYSAQDVADCVREALNAFQSTNIIVIIPGSGSLEGTYFTFNSNPASLLSYYVWYSYLDTSSPPAASGTPIKVLLPLGADANTVRNLTCQAINSYQFQAPDFKGMFFRCADPDGNLDFDSANRISNVSGVYGARPGTFEYSQFINHNHQQNTNAFPGADIGSPITSTTTYLGPVTGSSGGTETRPVNTYIYPFIRY